MKSALQACFSRYIVSLSRQGSPSGIHFHIRPATLLAGLVLIIALLLHTGARLFPISKPDNSHLQINTLMQAQQQLQTQLANSEAELALREEQIANMKEQIRQDIKDRQLMRQRLAMFDDVLAARTVRGVHILHPEAHWRKEEGLIDYQMVLVKGENYPRWALGHMEFSTRMPDGNIITLTTTSGKSNTKYEMTTHIFMEGTLQWHSKTPPPPLHVTLVNHLNKKIRQADFPVHSVTTITAEEAKP